MFELLHYYVYRGDIMPNKIKNLLGQQFGLLTVIERAENIGGRAAWLCKCECGGTKIARSSNLQTGKTKSCGCKRKEQLEQLHKSNIINLEGKRFGKLVALEQVGSNYGNNIVWKCQCDCGNIKNVPGNVLRNGLTQSCGCLKSKNEEKITQILLNNNISFEKEKVLYDDKTGEQYRFDFYIENSFFLEYDGEQHFRIGTGWSNKEKFIKTREKDLNKNHYCFRNNIPIIRIPYKIDYQLNDLLLETSQYVLTPEKEKIYYQ